MSRESSLSNCLEGCLCGRGPTKKIHLERKRDGQRDRRRQTSTTSGISILSTRTSSPSEGGFFKKRFSQRLETTTAATTTTTTSLIFGLRERMNDGGVNFLPEP